MGDQQGHGGWFSVLPPTVRLITVPHGFTLTVGGALAVTAGQRGFSGLLPIWLFVVGGSAGFCLLGVVGRAHRSAGQQARLPVGAAIFNVVPVAVLPLDYVLTTWVASDMVGFFLAGLYAVVFYIVGYSAFAAAVDRLPLKH